MAFHTLILMFIRLVIGVLVSLPGYGMASRADAALAVQWREEARALEHGEGITRNIGQAIALYCKAAMVQDAPSLYNLGWIYANGRSVERNDAYAAYFFRQAADQGDKPSERMLGIVGATAAKPPCVQDLEAAEQQRLNLLATTATQAELARQASKYELMANTPGKKHILSIVQRVAPDYGILPGLAFAIIRAESNFDPLAISVKNAQGLMQLIPETAERFRVRKPFDPEQNIRGGLAYLRWLLAYFEGDVSLVAAAYNAGEGTVERYRGVPPFKETQDYIHRIHEVFALAHHPFDPGVTEPSPELTRIKPTRPP